MHSPAAEFPVAVIMGFREVQNNRWTKGRFEPLAVIAGEHIAHEGSGTNPLRSEVGASEQYLLRGFGLKLYRDDAESYYLNLMGEQPRVFIICSEDDSGLLAPFLATASYDEATAHMEVEEFVFSVPMPAEIYRWIEQFVVNHYIPVRKKKRKRDNWKEQGLGRKKNNR